MIIGNLPQFSINNRFYKKANQTPAFQSYGAGFGATAPDTFTRTAVLFKGQVNTTPPTLKQLRKKYLKKTFVSGAFMHEYCGCIDSVRQTHQLFESLGDFETLRKMHLSKRFMRGLPMHSVVEEGFVDTAREIHRVFESQGDFETLRRIHLTKGRENKSLPIHLAANKGKIRVVKEIHRVFESQGDFETLKKMHLTKNKYGYLPIGKAYPWGAFDKTAIDKEEVVKEIHRVFKNNPETLIQMYLAFDRDRFEDFKNQNNDVNITLPKTPEIESALGEKAVADSDNLLLPIGSATQEKLMQLNLLLNPPVVKSKKFGLFSRARITAPKPAAPALSPPPAEQLPTVPRELDIIPIHNDPLREQLNVMWNTGTDREIPLYIEKHKNCVPGNIIGSLSVLQTGTASMIQAMLGHLLASGLFDKYADPAFDIAGSLDKDKDLKRFGAYCIQTYLGTLPDRESLGKEAIESLWDLYRILGCDKEFDYSFEDYEKAKAIAREAICDKVIAEAQAL